MRLRLFACKTVTQPVDETPTIYPIAGWQARLLGRPWAAIALQGGLWMLVIARLEDAEASAIGGLGDVKLLDLDELAGRLNWNREYATLPAELRTKIEGFAAQLAISLDGLTPQDPVKEYVARFCQRGERPEIVSAA